VNVYMICLIGETTLYCVLAFYLFWNIFFFSSSLVNLEIMWFVPAAPSQSIRSWGRPWIHNMLDVRDIVSPSIMHISVYIRVGHGCAASNACQCNI